MPAPMDNVPAAASPGNARPRTGATNDTVAAATSGQSAEAPRQLGELSPGQVRALKIAIVVMGAMIVVGLLVMVARIVYLAGGRASQAPAVASPARPETRVSLPAGATIKGIALDGNRLAIHHDGPSGPGVAIVDVATGQVMGRVGIAVEPPRQ